MGTHSLIMMREKQQDNTYVVYAVLYQQFDGGPTVVGAQLCRLLSELKITNGLPVGEKGGYANGAGCLFAQIISYFKIEAGGSYLINPNNVVPEEWNYCVDVNNMDVILSVTEGTTMLYTGGVKDCQTHFNMDPYQQSPKEYANHRDAVLKKYKLK
jgi:hypothetical protein